jgi:hypothetical protein
MAKTLKTILETYAPRSVDEKKFIDKHVIVKHPDRNGNGDEVFNASNIKTVKRASEHGYDAGKDAAVYEDVQQVDEIFGSRGLRLGKKQSELYPENEYTKYGEDHNRGPMGLPDMGHGHNFNRHMPKIESHPSFRAAVAATDRDIDHKTSQHQRMNHPAVQQIARDLGHSTFQVHDYTSKGPFYRRWGHMDFDKYSPTDGPTSPYFDRHHDRAPHEHD